MGRRRWLVGLIGVVLIGCVLAVLFARFRDNQLQPATTVGSTTTQEVARSTTEDGDSETSAVVDFHDPADGYMLEQVVVLSRHNIRAPLSTNGSELALATPSEWIEWTANPSELTERGGTLETMMGQYFRMWLEAEGLTPENWRPEEGAVRFYANAKQRTIATAHYFSSGILPVANVEIETHAAFDEMDPVFKPQITFLTDAYEQDALAQIAERGAGTDVAGVAGGLEDNFALLSDVVDYTNSEGYRSGELENLVTDDTAVVLEIGEEPSMTGSLKTATSLADALVLQYYEADDDLRAAFGHELTTDQWTDISQIKDVYGDVLFTAPLVATNVAHPLLEEIGNELDTDGRVFTFLCGHDSNIGSVLAALEAEEYDLPNTIEKKTPIGSKLVFERWVNENGEQFGRVRLLYQSVDQLKNMTPLSGVSGPESVELSFKGLEKNEDGLYACNDLRRRIQGAADAYDALGETYGESEQKLPEAA